MSDKVTPIDTRISNRPATHGDIQDLRRGLQGWVKNELDELERRVGEHFDGIDKRFDGLELSVKSIKALLEDKL